jgi:hypothetical protein
MKQALNGGQMKTPVGINAVGRAIIWSPPSSVMIVFLESFSTGFPL